MSLTPERWERVAQLFHQALEQKPEMRDGFLEQACGGDPELRREAERLLRSHEATGEFLDRPVIENETTRSTTGIDQIAHFRILEKLGEGGMGTVYKAEDTKLGRTVAIKLLSGRLVKKEEARARFLREAQAASALDHPNICTVYEVEEAAEGRLAIIMAYYDGQTLRQRLTQGPLSPREAMRFVLQAAQGLAAAHDAGIVHRDVKPANLMVTRDGTLKILDFGIAKIGGGDNLTMEGAHLGTVNYMSPEQARGEPLDQRVDIWALGVVFHELLTGTNPFRRENHLATINAILYEDPAPLPVREGALNLWPIVGRALQKDAAQRYHTMGELVAALEALRDSSDSASTLEAFRQLQPAPSVAVLPFKNLSADPENRYFSEGLTEDLAHELSMVAGLRLVSRASAHQFTADADPREVGRRLNVGTVVEGTVRTSGGRMRITAQLVNVADGFHLWSGRWDREIGDILEVQDEISRAIAERLVEQLRPAGGRAAGPRAPVHPEAYEHYLRGRYHLNQWTPASIDRAAECFRRTIELDGSLGPAWLGLARSYLHKATLGFDLPRPILEQGLQAAQKAVDLMPERPVALTIAAVCMGLLEWDWMPARQTVEAAFARDPKDPLVQGWYCEIVLLPQGRFDEALAATAEEGENEGLVLPARMRPGWLPLWRRQPEETLASVARSIAVAPAILAPYWIQALAWETLGRLPEAAESLRRALQLDPASTLSQGLLARLLAQQGQMAEAREVIGGLEALRKERYVAPSHLSWGCIAVGDFDRAFALLHEAMDQRDFLALFLETHPMYDPLRGDARYGALKARLSVRHPDAGSVGQSSL